MSKAPSTSYTLLFAAAVCVVCSLVVSSAATLLKERQDRNVLIDKQKNILGAVGLAASSSEEVSSLYASRIKELEVTDAKLPLYERVEDGVPVAYAFPISGKGLWSTLYGYLALEPDGNTVKGITFYKHGETPGLGAEIETPWFQENFIGKRILAADGSLASITVVKGKVAELIPPDQQAHYVDGISGATMTSKGVTQLVRAGLERYEPFLKSIRKEKK